MKNFDIEVVRTGIGFNTITIKAKNQKEAEEKALDEAGNHEFSEKDAEYEIVNSSKKEQKKLYVVLLLVSDFNDGKRICNSMMNQNYSSTEEIRKQAKSLAGLKRGEVSIYKIDEFVEACNEQDIQSMENYWITYVTIR